MTHTGSIFTVVGLAAYFVGSSTAWCQPVAEARTACSTGAVACLSRGWDETQRSWWYTTSQGSRLVPLSWALALKTADGQAAFLGQGHLVDQLGYLPNPVSEDNPHGLPVGFAVDHVPTRAADLMCDRFPETCQARTMREPWLGLNCSACHTNEIRANGTVMRIDGAPTMADFQGLVGGLQAALQATLDDTGRLDLFAKDVLGGPPDAAELDSLKTQMTEQIAWMAALEEINATPIEAGPARLDAQGHILTKVTMVNGATDQLNEFDSDAPASYPFIWNTHQQDKLQWNGIAGNVLAPKIFGQQTDIGALIRNTSEVIGVFAHVEANRGWAALGYDSSVRVTEMVGLERLLARLASPEWPEDMLGPIDRDLAAQGDALFDEHCASCHAHLDSQDLTTPAGEIMVPLPEAGTDVFLACNTFLRQAKAGNMARQKTFGLFGDRIDTTDAAHKMLVNAAVGSIFGKLDELLPALFQKIEPQGEGVRLAALGVQLEYLPGVTDPVKKQRAETCLTTDHPLLAYKSRPLNGIWATAPYLHNGSVPTLYDLLLPSKLRNTAPEGEGLPEVAGPTRPESFGVGGTAFDAAKVGFSTAPGDNPWTFNVRDGSGAVIPGNSNAGHDYGNADFTEEERRAIVEYLKTL